MSDRELDVVILGATGVTGRYVASYLAERQEATGARWAAAARDLNKLDRILSEIGVKAPQSIAADVGDPQSLAAMASRARVVLNAVGPYVLYARPVIEACVDAGTHYVDITGEIPFVREMIAEFNDRATASGGKIVQAAGFESLPPDLGVRLAAETARERFGQELNDVDLDYTVVDVPIGDIPSRAAFVRDAVGS